MIAINENYWITADTMNWILNESLPNADGKRSQNPRQSYFSTLEQCLNEIISRTGMKGSNIYHALAMIETARDQIVQAVEKASLKKEDLLEKAA